MLTELGSGNRGRREVDLVAIAFTVVLMALFTIGSDDDGSGRVLDATAAGLFVAACVALLARRRHPGAVALAILGLMGQFTVE